MKKSQILSILHCLSNLGCFGDIVVYRKIKCEFIFSTSCKQGLLMGTDVMTEVNITDDDNVSVEQRTYRPFTELIEELNQSNKTERIIRALSLYKDPWRNATKISLVYPNSPETQMALSIYEDLLDSYGLKEYIFWTNEYIKMNGNGTPKSKSAKLVANGVVEIAVFHNVLRPEIGIQLAFLHPTHNLGSVKAFYVEPSNFTHNFYMDPFNEDLWLVLLSTWLIILSTALIFIRISKLYLVNEHQQHSFHYSNMFSWVVAFITAQGLDVKFLANSFRLLALCARLLFIVLNAVYCGSIISSLSLHASAIKNFHDLINQGFIFERDSESASMGSYLKDFIRSENLTQEEIVVKGSEIKASLENDALPPKAFLYYLSSFYSEISKQRGIEGRWICDSISSVAVDRNPTLSAMVVRKDFQYRELFNHKIIQLKERGLNQRYRGIFNRNGLPLCTNKNIIQDQHNLSLYVVQNAFLVVFTVGALGTSIILACEIFADRFKRMDTNRVLWCLHSKRIFDFV